MILFAIVSLTILDYLYALVTRAYDHVFLVWSLQNNDLSGLPYFLWPYSYMSITANLAILVLFLTIY